MVSPRNVFAAMMAFAAGATSAVAPAASATPGAVRLICGVKPGKASAALAGGACARIKAQVDRAMGMQTLVDPRLSPSAKTMPAGRWIMVSLEFLPADSVSAKVSHMLDGRHRMLETITVSVSDRAIGPMQVDMLGREIGRQLAGRSK